MVDIAVRLHAEYVAYSENGGDDPFLWDAATEISRLRSDLAACRKELAEAKSEADACDFARLAAEARVSVLETENERLSRPITMQDVRLAVGEGKLSGLEVLAGANAELVRRTTLHDVLSRAALEPPKC